MKYLIILLILTPLLSLAQVSYNLNQYDVISSKDSIVTIDWITQSSHTQKLDLNLYINFINQANSEDFIGTYIIVNLILNEEIINTFNFKAADHITNNVVSYNYVTLKPKDHLYFKFTLIPKSNDDSYIITMRNKSSSNITYTSNSTTPVRIKPIIYTYGMFGEAYSTNSPKKKRTIPKHIRRQDRINNTITLLGLLIGL